MVVLDSNVLSELMRPQPAPAVKEWLEALGSIGLATTALTIFEIEYGLHRLPAGARRRDLHSRFVQLASVLTILPLDEVSAAHAGAFRAMREELGLPTTPSDMMIAGIALQASAPLATRNVRDFERLPVELIDPWRAFGQTAD